MAIYNFLGNIGSVIATSLGLRPKPNPYAYPDRLNLAESSPQVINTGDEISERTPIFRDLGLQSRTVQEAASILMEAAPSFPGMSLFMDRYGFRSLNANVRDYSEAIRINLLQRAETLSLTNGLCNRALQVRTDLIVSEGFRVEADPTEDCPKHVKKAIQDVLDEHSELNGWTGADERTYERVLDLQRTGESFRRLPSLFKNIGNSVKFRSGKFICGHVSPHLVRGISVDPWNYEILEKVYLEQYAFPNTGIEDLCLKIVRDEKMAANEFGSIRGDCFFSALNRRPGCTRGVTDLAPAIEWLDIYDQMLIMDVERVQMMMRFIWDVTIEGASPQHILKFAETLKQNPPRPASIRVHNEKERWDAISPDLRLSDSKDLREDIFLLAWGSMGLPRPWFTDGENANRACYSEDTETLTIDGWKKLDDLTVDSIIATVNPDTKEIEYHKPDKMFVYPYTGKMVHFKNNDFDVMVTPEHKMWAKRARNERKGEFYEKIEAKDMLKAGRYTMLLAGSYGGGFDEDFTLPSVPTGNGRAVYPEVTIPGDLWAEFLGYVISEGHIRSHTKEPRVYYVSVCQKKENSVPLIRECIRKMNKLGFNFGETQKDDGTYVWQVCDKALNLWLCEHCGMMAKNKKIPKLCWNYTQRRMQILLDALVDGDGSRGGRHETNRRGCTYFTSSPQLIDDMQKLCCHLGLASKMRIGTRAWAIQILDHQEAAIRKAEGTKRKDYKTGIKEVDYLGKVYCFDVKNHLFITRRAGKTAISHNSIENMTDPNFAWARTRRRRFIGDMTLEHRYALQVAWDAGRFRNLIPIEKAHDWLKIKVVSRDPDRKGYESVGATWSDMANSLSTMLSASLIDQDSAVEIIRTVVGSYGFEINPENLKKMQNVTENPEENMGGQSPVPDEPAMVGSTGEQSGMSPAGQMQMQESKFRKISPRGIFKEGRKKGILGSSNPLDSFYNEAMNALRESQKNNRKMRSNF